MEIIDKPDTKNFKLQPACAESCKPIQIQFSAVNSSIKHSTNGKLEEQHDYYTSSSIM